MADFLRPEARAAIWRAREVIAALVVLALGLRWGLGSFGILAWFGWALAGLAVAFGFAAVQRMRFAPGSGGPGVVQIDERRIAYFGPLTGGAIALDDLVRLDIDHEGHPAHWRLTGAEGDSLDIPLTAEQADALFDAFTALPGMRSARLVEASRAGRGITRMVWTRPGADVASAHPRIEPPTD